MTVDAGDVAGAFLLGPVLHAALKGIADLFHDDQPQSGRDSAQDALLRALAAANAPGAVIQPDGSSALLDAAQRAAEAYQRTGGAATATDAKAAALLAKYFASNEATRKEVSAIVQEIQFQQDQLKKNPEWLNDPVAMKGFGLFLDDRLGRIQQAMERAKMDSAQRAEILGLLTDEYHATAAAADQHTPKDGGSNTDTAADGGSGGATATSGGGGDPAAGGAGSVSDPLAGMGLPGTLGGMSGLGDPMSMLGPALAGMSSIPGSLGGLASSLPGAAAGLAPLAGQMAGLGSGDGFKDDAPRDGAKSADFEDDHRKDDPEGKPDEVADGDDRGGKHENPEASPAPATTPAAAAGAVPATAGGDPSLVVQMPDGSPVTAASAQHASAVRAVVNGTSVADAWKQAHVSLPPPGTPITEPADPSHLTPGMVAQFKTREPVMYMGNGKIWLDGQLQPQGTLPTTDFLGWVDPAQQAGTATAAAPAARATGT